ncbi:hypothetical protein [Acetobacter sp. UBA5411]|uniref:hypothetical protein n=1 Tax=Acetobacter sp. UBA5411 TaxID=1945905 RepID=UPI0025B8FB6C|nr:hypothetical protein [Acetobacter sp. UBA5411]
MNKDKPNELKFMNISNTCKIYGIGRTYCYKLLAEGHIKAKKLGGRTLVSTDSANNYFSKLPDYKSQASV